MDHKNNYELQRWQEQFHKFFMQEMMSLEHKFTWIIQDTDFDEETKMDETYGDLFGARDSVVMVNRSPIALESNADESSVVEELSDIENLPSSSITGNQSSLSFNFQADLDLFGDYASSDGFNKSEEIERRSVESSERENETEAAEADVESNFSSDTYVSEPLTKRKKNDEE